MCIVFKLSKMCNSNDYNGQIFHKNCNFYYLYSLKVFYLFVFCDKVFIHNF